MKNIVSFFFFGIVFLGFAGCSRTIQSKEVINQIHTSSDLIKELGQPSEKNVHPGYEEWVYFRDTVASGTNVKVIDSSAKVSPEDSVQEIKNQPLKKHYQYVSFLVDSNNIVAGHKNNGVDLTKKVPMSFGESLLEVLAGIAAVAILITVEVINNKLDM